MTELGLLDDLAAVGIPTAEFVYYSKRGQRIWREPLGMATDIGGLRSPSIVGRSWVSSTGRWSSVWASSASMLATI